MATKLVFAPETEQDLIEAYVWYEDRRNGLGEEFLCCVEACIEGITRNPEIYERVYGNYRRGLIRRFPYAVFYEWDAGTVTIYSVFHTSRNPEQWRQRLL